MTRHSKMCSSEQGYLGMFSDPDAGPLEAVLMVEQVARALGTVATGALSVVAPALGVTGLRGPVGISLGRPRDDTPVRFAAASGTLLVAEHGEAFLCDVDTASSLPTSWSYPAASVSLGSSRPLGPGSADRMVAWWRVTMAAEIVGNACPRASMSCWVTSSSANSSVEVSPPCRPCSTAWRSCSCRSKERAGWPTGPPGRERHRWTPHSPPRRAWRRGGGRSVNAIRSVAALGLTTEFDLHMWTMRLRALCAEAGGLFATQVDAGRLRWRPSGSLAAP